MINKLFVYGTLHPDRAPEALQDLVSRFQSCGTGSVQGKLYNLGDFPGVRLEEGVGLVPGEVFLLPEDPDTFERLDAYEGYLPEAPADSLYVRQRVSVRMDDGSELEAWIYVYNGPLPESPHPAVVSSKNE